MEYRLDIYTKNAESLLERLAMNCRKRRLEAGYSRKTLAEKSGVPAPTIERFETTGKISLESFCKIAIVFDYYEEIASLLGTAKYSTGEELATINKNKHRKKGR